MKKENEFVIQPSEGTSDPMDLVRFFLLKEDMTQKKIQKLCYYAQAWSLVYLGSDIVKGIKFQAWVHGPVNTTIRRNLVEYGWDTLSLNLEKYDGSKKEVKKLLETRFSPSQLEVLEDVWNTYGRFSAGQLESLTHQEKPWLEAREGFGDLDICTVHITNKAMKEYYSQFVDKDCYGKK